MVTNKTFSLGLDRITLYVTNSESLKLYPQEKITHSNWDTIKDLLVYS